MLLDFQGAPEHLRIATPTAIRLYVLRRDVWWNVGNCVRGGTYFGAGPAIRRTWSGLSWMVNDNKPFKSAAMQFFQHPYEVNQMGDA